MKRFIYYIGVLLAMTSCAKDADIVSSGDAIGDAITIKSNIATRVSDSKWEANDAIGLYMTATTFGDKCANTKFVTTVGNGIFASDAPLYYPASGSMELFAYYPYVEDVNLSAYPITSADQVDLLSATKSIALPCTAVTDLTFNHLLSKISLTIEAGYGLTTANLANLSVSLRNVSTTATFDLVSKTVNGDSFGAVSDFDLTTSADGTSASAIVIPQTLSGVWLYFTTESHGIYRVALTTATFEVGKEYTYTATLNMTDTKSDSRFVIIK